MSGLEWLKTGGLCAIAVVLVALALASAPDDVAPEAFAGLGERFFPGFDDPNLATSLEVVEYDEKRGLAKAFKVHLKDGRYTIPSHHDYPADAKDRLKKTAAAVIDLKRDAIRSERVEDHAALAVLDPLDVKAALKGRGTRVTLRDANGVVLADIILGQKGDRKGVRYARLPGQARTYATRVGAEREGEAEVKEPEISARFSDWIETDLLKLDAATIQKIQINSYSIDEVEGRIKGIDQIALAKGDAGRFAIEGAKPGEELDEARVSEMTRALDDLKIAGVRPKPAGLAADLSAGADFRKSREALGSLRQKGYLVTRDGQVLSSEGEAVVETKDGVAYTLRFGEVLVGEGDEVTAGKPADAPKDGGATTGGGGPGEGAAATPPAPRGSENRYLFLTARFDPSMLPEPVPETPKPDATDDEKKRIEGENDRKKKEWQAKVDEGRKRAHELSERFARWYYVIPADAYGKVRLTRADLVKAPPTPPPAPPPALLPAPPGPTSPAPIPPAPPPG